jgi:hypothetical protein
MARKTIEVGKVLRMANTFLAAENTKADEREGVCSLLEAILFETGNYEGFRYLEGSDYPEESDGLGSRRFYFASKNVLADEAEDLRDINVIRV